MHDTKMRKAMVEHRVTLLRRKREKRLGTVLTMLSLIITAGLAWVTATFVGGRQGSVPGLYGSTMLSEDAGGYVIVGVISFSVAVLITVLCVRYREKK